MNKYAQYNESGELVNYFVTDDHDFAISIGGVLVEKTDTPIPLETLKAEKLIEVSNDCSATIHAGIDVTLPNGETEHFSMEETDQINMASALSAVQLGAIAFPYHADGELCRMYSAEEISIIVQSATNHKIYHTTYCNHLNVWIRRETSEDTLKNIKYGSDLPDDLSENMAMLLATVTNMEA